MHIYPHTPYLHEGHQCSVDGHGHLHWQLPRHHRGDDDDALEQELVSGAVFLLQAFHQHVARGRQRKGQEHKQRQARLFGISGYLIKAISHNTHPRRQKGMYINEMVL